MQTVVFFIPSEGQWRNSLQTRSLLKVGFVDSRYDGVQPRAQESWLVEVKRENLAAPPRLGCFILHPIRQVLEAEQNQLHVGLFDLETYGDTLLVVPHDPTQLWVMSSEAKTDLATEAGKNALMVYGGGPKKWSRRPPPDDVLNRAARKLDPKH
jgi:hypothetical protein